MYHLKKQLFHIKLIVYELRVVVLCFAHCTTHIVTTSSGDHKSPSNVTPFHILSTVVDCDCGALLLHISSWLYFSYIENSYKSSKRFTVKQLRNSFVASRITTNNLLATVRRWLWKIDLCELFLIKSELNLTNTL